MKLNPNLGDKQTILQLALQEAFRKRDNCQSEINELQNCRDGWQEMIDQIRAWQDELKENPIK